MAKTNQPTFGNYNTPIATIKHSANASWSGYQYQGLCALHYALVLLRSNWDVNKTRMLNLEGYEDFAILDSNNLIVSFHQCKCVNAPKNYTTECQVMSDKHDYWLAQNRLSPDYDKMYFHTNQTNIYNCRISNYVYNTSNGLCSPEQISELINNEISGIILQRNIPGSATTKQNRLVNFLIKHVECLHEEQISTQQDMFDIACAKPIPFSELIKVLEIENDNLSMEEKARTCRHHLILEMNNRLLTCLMLNGTKVVDFMKELDTLNDYSLIQLVRRLFPDEDILNSHIDRISIKSKERADYLFNIINEVNDVIDYTTFDWKSNVDKTKQTPSTLGSNKKPEEFCPYILQNIYSNDILRDYRWIVGAIDHKVNDIVDAANLITQINAIKNEYITQPQKVGLLDINSKNHGDN